MLNAQLTQVRMAGRLDSGRVRELQYRAKVFEKRHADIHRLRLAFVESFPPDTEVDIAKDDSLAVVQTVARRFSRGSAATGPATAADRVVWV
jgi:hypothetical protein